jgi:hypothetical protein
LLLVAVRASNMIPYPAFNRIRFTELSDYMDGLYLQLKLNLFGNQNLNYLKDQRCVLSYYRWLRFVMLSISTSSMQV